MNTSKRLPATQIVDAAQVAHLRQSGKLLFELGTVYGSPAVLEHLEVHSLYPNALLGAHCHGDYGVVNEDAARANDRAVIDGGRILSAYLVEGKSVWVITDAVTEQGVRLSTTMIFPSEH